MKWLNAIAVIRITAIGPDYTSDCKVNPRGNRSELRTIKLVHTVIWAIMAAGILALPWIGWTRRFASGIGVTLMVMVESLVLAMNHCQCPLTNIAPRYTIDRADNFDIYLPAWLARRNKQIFVCLFFVSEVVVLNRWFSAN